MIPVFDAAVLTYPWSVLEQGAEAARRHVGEGVGFSVAAAYHSLRQLDPLSTRATVREIPDAAVYWTPDAQTFAQSAIRPVVATGEVRDAYARARDELGARGARVGAWVSVLHTTALASRHPASAITVATGDVLRHALCPGSSDAREYAVALIRDLMARDAPDFLELEATGYHGWRHDSRHDKAAIPVSDDLNFLLSVCFCVNCAERIASLGTDPDAVRARFRNAIAHALRRPRAATDGGPSVADMAVVDEARRRIVVESTARLVAAAGATPVLVHAGPEPHRTGSRVALDAVSAAELPARVAVVVSTDGEPRSECRETVDRAVSHYVDAADVVVSRRVWSPDVDSGEQLSADVTAIVRLGARGVRFHTYGLLNEERLGWIRTAVEGVA